MNEKNILVLGASGFVGRWVARQLMKMGLSPHLAVRDPSTFMTTQKRWSLVGDVHQFDALNDLDLKTVLSASEPDIVFNLVGYGIDRGEKDEHLSWALNAEFPQKLAESLGENSSETRCRLIHVGSALEYGEQSGNLSEDSVMNPSGIYGESKFAGTQNLLASSTPLVEPIVARLFTVFGPGEHPGRLLPSLKRAAKVGSRVDLSDGAQQRDFTYVEDVANALVSLATIEFLPWDIVNLASGTLTPVREFILSAAEVLSMPIEHLNFGAVPRYADEMQHEPVSVSRCQAMLGSALEHDIKVGLVAAIGFEEEQE